MKYYSPKTRGFYTPEIHGENMPDDVVEISDARWQELLDAQSRGQRLTHNENGLPTHTGEA